MLIFNFDNFFPCLTYWQNMENDYFWEITFSEAPSNDFFAHLMKSCLCKAVTFTEKEMKKKKT